MSTPQQQNAAAQQPPAAPAVPTSFAEAVMGEAPALIIFGAIAGGYGLYGKYSEFVLTPDTFVFAGTLFLAALVRSVGSSKISTTDRAGAALLFFIMAAACMVFGLMRVAEHVGKPLFPVPQWFDLLQIFAFVSSYASSVLIRWKL